jgi:kynureninase
MRYENSLSFARSLDAEDPLKKFRGQFYFPQFNGEDVIYFTGNSLGLQPKSTKDYILQELEDWKTYGVEGHFHAKNPWFSYHEILTEQAARLVGAKPVEVVIMNQLTVNVHLLLVLPSAGKTLQDPRRAKSFSIRPVRGCVAGSAPRL